jgi:hypothetical protein
LKRKNEGSSGLFMSGFVDNLSSHRRGLQHRLLHQQRLPELEERQRVPEVRRARPQRVRLQEEEFGLPKSHFLFGGAVHRKKMHEH